MLTHGSLFSGIGGFDLGFERAGIKTVWQVEIDDYCRRVLAKHFTDARRYSDIRNVCGIQWERSPLGHASCGKWHLLPVDILSGGFPCQDISNAGKRAGIDGERSGLWSEYARIICELRPRYVVVENVAALLGRGMERVLGDLAACGYDAEWDCIRACDVGAPHRRDRVWIVAYPKGNRAQRRIFDSRRDRLAWEDGNEGKLADSERAERRPDSQAGNESNRDNAGREEAASRIRECREDVADAQSYLWGASRDDGPKPFNRGGSGISHAVVAGLEGDECGILAQPGEGGLDADITRSSWWAIEPDVGRVAHGIPARVDRLRGLGNAIVPQIAEWIGRRIAFDFYGPSGNQARETAGSHSDEVPST